MNKLLDNLKNMNLLGGILFSIIFGIIIGILTDLGQGILPGSWNSLANSGVVWLLSAFMLGALGINTINAIFNGIFALFGMVTGYYVYSMTIQNVPHSNFFIMVWTGAAVIGGIIFGLAGYLWGREKGEKHKYGSGLIGGVYITEGLTMFIHFNDYRHMISVAVVEILAGFLLVLILENSNKRRVVSLLTLIPIVILGLIGYQTLFIITSYGLNLFN